MPRTIHEGFVDFLPKLTPSTFESEAAKKHRASIHACLKNKYGNSVRFFRTGSFGNGTSISGYSDVDYFAVVPTDQLQENSGTSLTHLRNALDTRFPNTGVRVSCPAVLVPFGKTVAENTEVVPADAIGTQGGYTTYEIPNCAGKWRRSSPDAHNAYVRDVDKTLGGKVKPLIRFIKAWRCVCNAPISSFYLELRVAAYAEQEKTIIYDIDVKNVLALLNRIGLADMNDPMGISGRISACSSDVKLEDALSKLSTALTRATKARDAESSGDTKTAFAWWDKLYAGNFPSYYR